MERATQLFIAANIIAIGLIVGATILSNNNGDNGKDEGDSILDVCLSEHSSDLTHYHATLEIYIRGEQIDVPAETGVDSNCMRGIHTHDATGVLHIESPTAMEARLEHFFDIWDQPLSESELLDATVADGESITLAVDGNVVNDFENHVLADGQVLVLRLE